jgi:hypothetical protein
MLKFLLLEERLITGLWMRGGDLPEILFYGSDFDSSCMLYIIILDG